MMLVSLLDYRVLPEGAERGASPPETLTAQMVAGVSRQRGGWLQKESDAKLGKVVARRVEWKGKASVPRQHHEGGQGVMRGVLYVGLTKGLGVSLHAAQP